MKGTLEVIAEIQELKAKEIIEIIIEVACGKSINTDYFKFPGFINALNYLQKGNIFKYNEEAEKYCFSTITRLGTDKLPSLAGNDFTVSDIAIWQEIANNQEVWGKAWDTNKVK